VDEGDRHVQHVRRDVGSAIHHQIPHRGAQPLLEPVAQRTEPGSLLGLFPAGEQRGASERHGTGDVLGARANAVLLSPAVDDRLDGLAVAHDQRADALGGADLVAGEREQRAGQITDRHRHLAKRLDRVGVKDHVGRTATGRDLGDRLNDPDFVVHPHDRDQCGPVGQGSIEGIEAHLTVGVHREHHLAAAEMTDRVRRRQHRLVLDRAHHRAGLTASVSGGERRPDDPQVVGFGAA
jgi:hypothetical protein